MKAIIFDSAKCNGCYGCQLACKDEHVGNDWSPISASEPDTGAFWCKLEETTHGQVPKVCVEAVGYQTQERAITLDKSLNIGDFAMTAQA